MEILHGFVTVFAFLAALIFGVGLPVLALWYLGIRLGIIPPPPYDWS